jgi:hypothetical protein
MYEDSLERYSTFIPNGQRRNLERRKDARKKVDETQLMVASCRTMDIAIKFDFPDARNTIMANGEVVRTSMEGVGIRFRMFFKK